MNDDDLKDCFAMFALAGAVMAGKSRSASDVWDIAEEMMKERAKRNQIWKPTEDENEENDDGGIVSALPKRTYKRKR